MDIIADIRAKIAANQWEFSRHALDQSLLRGISVTETREAITNAEVIEDYPDDKYGPSCLLLGLTSYARPLHIPCTYPTRPLVKVITIYQPSPAEWLEFKTRKRA